MTVSLPHAVNSGDDAPLTLAEACDRFFGGRITPATLRAEHRRGRLVIERIGRADFVTERAIREMRQKCRVPQNAPDSGFDRQGAPADASDQPHGSSSIEESISPQDALLARLNARTRPSGPTLPKGTHPGAKRAARIQ